MKIKISFISLLSLLVTFGASSNSLDSVGIKVIKGKKYIIHKLDPQETLYSLGKRYHVSVSEIQNVNPENEGGYRIDQIGRTLLIPYKKEEFSEPANPPSKTAVRKQHLVNAGETIYSISKRYNISQKNIMDWNELESTVLDIGQKLWIVNPSRYPSNDGSKEKAKNTEQRNEIVHVVDLGETIYSISRQYDVRQSDIIELNDLEDNNIAVGQKLIVKSEEKKVAVINEEESQVENQEVQQSVHKAQSGENYEMLADIYGLRESELKKWNEYKEPFSGGELIKIVPPETDEVIAENDDIETEQPSNPKIHTVKSGETLYSLSEKYNVDVQDLRKWNSLANYQLSLGQKLYVNNPDALVARVPENIEEQAEKSEIEEAKPKVTENPQKKDTKAFFTVEEDDMPKINKIKEMGIAEVIEGSDGTEKYLALHRTAKIGTIMQVRNDLNDQIVFVRVLGKLPNTGVDKKVIIKISKKAFEKLGGVDYKFPVEISYLPLKD